MCSNANVFGFKIWAVRTCDPPQPGIIVCIKTFVLDKYQNFFQAKVSLLQARVITFANHQQSLELLELISDDSFFQ